MIRKGFYIALLCFAVCGQGLAQDTVIRFVEGMRWREIVGEATRTGKFIFVDCYATWCGPCKLMDQKIYNAPQVSLFFNRNFLSVKMQMDTSARDHEDVKMNYGDAHTLKEQFGVNAFPTFLFFSPDGKIIHRGLGYTDTMGLVQLGKNALEPDEQFYTLWDKYKTHGLSLGSIRKLSLLAASLKEDSLAHSAANDYIRRVSRTVLWTAENIEFMYKFTTSTRDPGFALFRDSADWISSVDKRFYKAACEGITIQILYNDVIKPLERSLDGKPDWKKMNMDLHVYGALGEKTLQTYMPKLVFQSAIEPAMAKSPGWEAVLQLIKEQKSGENEKYLLARAIVFYERQMRTGDSTVCRDFVAAVQYDYTQYPDLNKAPQHNEFAWELFQHDNDRRDLNIALGWSKYTIDTVYVMDSLKKDHTKAEYVDTYANLLYKLERKDEALSWEEKAVALNPDPRYLEFEETLKKMKAGKPTW